MPAKPKVTKDILYNLYIEKGHTTAEICQITKVKSPITITKHLKRHNVPIRDVNSLRQKQTFGNRSYEEFGEYLKTLYEDEEKSIILIIS